MREGVLILRTPLHLKAKHYNSTTIDHDILSIPAFLNHKIFIIIQYICLLMYFVSFILTQKYLSFMSAYMIALLNDDIHLHIHIPLIEV